MIPIRSSIHVCWLAEKAAYYEAHPELKTTPGSGWKPYNRIKWEYELNLVDGTPPLDVGPRRLPRGVYFAVVEAGGERVSRKIVVLD
jgi:hypothetical protein